MSFEERMEFLTQSIESHDRQIGELVERMDRMSERVDRMSERVDRTTANIDALDARLDRFIEAAQLNFDRLTKAMIGLTEHVADHHRRLESLER